MDDLTSTLLGVAGLMLILCFSRSVRGGFSGPIGRWIGVAQIPLAIAAIWLIALAVAWWTIAVFVGLSIIVGLLVNRSNLAAWVNLQPMTGVGALLCTVAGWAARMWP